MNGQDPRQEAYRLAEQELRDLGIVHTKAARVVVDAIWDYLTEPMTYDMGSWGGDPPPDRVAFIENVKRRWELEPKVAQLEAEVAQLAATMDEMTSVLAGQSGELELAGEEITRLNELALHRHNRIAEERYLADELGEALEYHVHNWCRCGEALAKWRVARQAGAQGEEGGDG